ncbi:MAG: peptide chain release factor N(5)-glutamine methyltransferase [Bdellovibrionales bacterium]|nr:peptide chain release factor N(5)-glutamine methyltransferase [Bdellovibrionales bacterium]
MTLKAAIDEMIRAFQKIGMEQPQFEARQLVQECLNLTFAQLMSHPDRNLDPTAEAKLKEWQVQRLAGVPLAYLSHRKGFYKYDFLVEKGVLVPRPETEIVVETALRRMEDRASVSSLCDLGCGSGCIGLSLVAEMTELRLWSVDASQKACDVTWRNAVNLGVQGRVKIENKRVEDWEPGLHFDMIVANPPYIGEHDTEVQPSVRQHEPHEALFSGDDGMEAIRSWASWAHSHLSPKGIVIFEIGAGQSRLVQDMFAKLGYDSIQVDRDLAGHERVVSAIKVR